MQKEINTAAQINELWGREDRINSRIKFEIRGCRRRKRLSEVGVLKESGLKSDVFLMYFSGVSSAIGTCEECKRNLRKRYNTREKRCSIYGNMVCYADDATGI